MQHLTTLKPMTAARTLRAAPQRWCWVVAALSLYVTACNGKTTDPITDPDAINPVISEGLTAAQLQEALQQARTAIREDRVHDAIAALDELIKQAPDSADAFTLRGIARMRLGEFKFALPDFQTAAEIKPSADLYFNLGNVYHVYGFFDRAISAYRMAQDLSADRNDPEILNNMASAYIQLDRPSEALPLLEQVVRARPGDGEALTNMGVAHYKLGDLNAAERALLSAIAANANYAEAHYNLARVYETMKQPSAAAASYQQYINVKPSAPDRGIIERTIERLMSPTS
jgi:tetratricopeptide (TPR) repeat protein